MTMCDSIMVIFSDLQEKRKCPKVSPTLTQRRKSYPRVLVPCRLVRDLTRDGQVGQGRREGNGTRTFEV